MKQKYFKIIRWALFGGILAYLAWFSFYFETSFLRGLVAFAVFGMIFLVFASSTKTMDEIVGEIIKIKSRFKK